MSPHQVTSREPISAIIITRKFTPIHPPRLQRQQPLINPPIRLNKHRLKHMIINPIIRPIPLRIPRPQPRTMSPIIRIRLKFHQHNIHLLPSSKNNPCSSNLGLDRFLSVWETFVDARFDPFRVAFDVVCWTGEIGGMREEDFHPGIVAGTGFGGLEEEGYSCGIGGPEHGLDVRCWPAVD